MSKDISRYQRQYLFPKIGEERQRKISSSKVTLIGCGALGTVIANTLVRCGVENLTIVDRDFVELNNLQRQVLFNEEDVENNLPKAIAAKQKLEKINSQANIEAIVADANYSNIENLVKGRDLVLDGTDNFDVRYTINEACVKHNIPWIYGGCVGDQGLTMVVIPKKTPCLSCYFQSAPPPELTPTCDTAGILSPIVNIVSSLQSMEAIKILSGQIEQTTEGLYSYNVWEKRSQVFGTKQEIDPECPVCQKEKFEYLSGDKGMRTSTLCGRNAVQISRDDQLKIDFKIIAEKLEHIGKVTSNAFLLKCDFNESGKDYELTLFLDGRAIIKGTNDISRAKSIYSKYISV